MTKIAILDSKNEKPKCLNVEIKIIFGLRIVHLHNKISFLEQSEHSTGLPIVASYPESLMGWRKKALGLKWDALKLHAQKNKIHY